MISVIIFEINIVAEQKEDYWQRFFCFYELPLPLTRFLPLLPYRCPGVPQDKMCEG